MRNLALPLALLAVMTASPAYAQRVDQLPAATGAMIGGYGATEQASASSMTQSIAAVVNDSIVSTSDIKARLGLALLSAGLPDSQETRQKLMPQVLRSLIDEQLQLQEGKKEGITISAEEIDTAMTRLASDNRIPGGSMTAFLRDRGIPPSTLQAQVKAALTWNRVVARKVRPHIDIGDDEINAVIQRMRENAGRQEFLISEIFLAVDKPEDDAEMAALANKLVEQIRGGVVFGAAARQFSQGLGASNGGDIGWIQVGQLAPEIDKVLPSLKPAEVAGPIRTASGYHILGIRDKRTIAVGDVKEMSVKLQQIFHPFTEQTNKAALMREAAKIRETITDCSSIQQNVARDYPAWRWQDLGDVKMDKAPAWLAEKVSGVEIGRATEAMGTDKGALILFVCDRSMPENVDREAIRNAIGTEKMELMARRLQRDLRKNAFIDIRLKGTP